MLVKTCPLSVSERVIYNNFKHCFAKTTGKEMDRANKCYQK